MKAPNDPSNHILIFYLFNILLEQMDGLTMLCNIHVWPTIKEYQCIDNKFILLFHLRLLSPTEHNLIKMNRFVSDLCNNQSVNITARDISAFILLDIFLILLKCIWTFFLNNSVRLKSKLVLLKYQLESLRSGGPCHNCYELIAKDFSIGLHSRSYDSINNIYLMEIWNTWWTFYIWTTIVCTLNMGSQSLQQIYIIYGENTDC